MDYRAFLKDRAKSGIVLGLSNMSLLMERLKNPQNSLRIIHIAGTNGKGSVGAFLEGILRQKGLRVARYTSPAVFDALEKYTINSSPISEEDMSLCTQMVAEACFDGINPTLFETETAIAFLYFAKEKCDIAIIETGMGGREDATNIIKSPVCSVICPISMDHMSFLGDTIEEIALAKAGIIKERCAAISAQQDERVKKVIEDIAREKNAPLTFAKEGKYISFDGERQYFDYEKIKNLSICALGKYQIQNAALAIEAAKVIDNFSEEEIKNGIKDVIWHGRFEAISKNPCFIIDGAHNEAAAIALKDSIKEYFSHKKINLITATFADKEYQKSAKILAPLANRIFAVHTDHPRALSAQEYAKELKIHNQNTEVSTICEAVKACMNDTDAITVCFGTLSILADVRAEVIKNSPLSMQRVDKIFTHPIYQSILREIEKSEKDRIYCLHNFSHAMDAARIAYILALEEGLKIRKDVIYASALLHDLGRWEQYKSGKSHEEESVRIAKAILPLCGFLQEETKEIAAAIHSHGEDTGDGLASVLQRGDKLSRMCLTCKSISSCKWKEEEFNMNILY